MDGENSSICNIGPLTFTAQSFSSVSHTITAVFKVTHIIFIFYNKKIDNQPQTAKTEYLLVNYSNVKQILMNAKKQILIILKDEPLWNSFTRVNMPYYQKEGFKTILLIGKNKFIRQIKKILFKYCPILHTVPESMYVYVPTLVRPLQIPQIVKYPDTLINDIQEKLEVISVASKNPCLYDSFDFPLTITPEELTIHALEGIVQFYQIPISNSSVYTYAFKRDQLEFTTQIEWLVLKDEVTRKFLPNTNDSITMFRGTTQIGYSSISEAFGQLKDFIKSGLWNEIEITASSPPITLQYMKIHNRDTWTVPFVSLELVKAQYAIIAFNILLPEQFVTKYHKSHPGRFSEGAGHFWAPELDKAIFYLKKKGDVLVIQYTEIISWNFGPELYSSSMNEVAHNRGLVAAQLASYMTKP